MPLVYIGVTYFFILGWKNRSTMSLVASGVIVALGSYFRSEILLLPVFLALALFVLERSERRLARFTLLGLIPVILLLLPWSLRNYAVFDRVIPTNSGLWMAMWQSFGEYQNDFGAVNNDMVTLQQMRALGYTEEYDTPEYDDLFRGRVLEVLRTRPGWVLWTAARRVARIPVQMHSWGIPQTDDMTTPGSQYREAGKVDSDSYWDYVTADPFRFLGHLGARGINALIFLSVLIAAFRYHRSFWKEGWILLLVPLYNILIHAVIGVHARYILPTNVLLLIFVARVVLGNHHIHDPQLVDNHPSS
jgi:hypothetical protein